MVLFVLSAAATTQIYTLSLHDALPISIAEVAGSNRSNDVEEPDRRECPAPDLGRKAAIDQIGRQMDRDEGELEAAREKAEHEQNVTAVAKCFREGLPRGLRGGRSYFLAGRRR